VPRLGADARDAQQLEQILVETWQIATEKLFSGAHRTPPRSLPCHRRRLNLRSGPIDRNPPPPSPSPAGPGIAAILDRPLAWCMDVLVIVLAIAGFLAALRGLSRASLGLLVRGVEVVMTREQTDIRARRGDITGLGTADEHGALARRHRRRSVLAVGFWATLIVVPLVTPWTRWLYAACSPLWLIPARRR
jgi:hypothetical protein